MPAGNVRDMVAGASFAALGLGLAVVATGYRIGTAASMGPGFFPLMLGTLLALIGCLIAVNAWRKPSTDEEPAPHSLRGLLIVVGVVCLFALMLDRAGMMLTVFVVSALSSYLTPESSLPKALVTGAVLSLLSFVLFVWGLGVPMPAWPSF